MTARIPVTELNRRAPEQGRIRAGKRTEKGAPTKLEAFRFTSSDQNAIEAIAAKYGGTAGVWDGAPGRGRQWEVFTPLARVAVALPPDCLGDGVTYELWGGGYCVRRCDGTTCDQPQDGPDGMEMVPGPCVCATESGPAKCKGKLRLNVILRDIPFGGTWRLETSSEYALREMPGMVDMILAMQEGGLLTSATLVLDQRTRVVYTKGKAQTRNYGVPMLAVPESLDDILVGAAQLSAYNRSSPALGEGPPRSQPSAGANRGGSETDRSNGDTEPSEASVTAPPTDDDIAEAEIVESINAEQHAALVETGELVATAWNVENPEDPITAGALLQALAAQVTGGSNQRVADIDVGQGARIGQLLANIVGGAVEFRGIQNGRVKVRK